jgi:sulfur-carrier protein
MRLVYFAQVREAIGVDGEEREVAPDQTIGKLIDQLSQESAPYANAFANRAKLRFALDQQMARADTPIGDARELAIFPPVTGG